LGKIAVPQTDGREHFRLPGAHDLVGDFTQRAAGIGRSYRSRDNHSRWRMSPHCLNGSFHRRPRRKPIVDERHDSRPKIDGVAVLSVCALSPIELDLFRLSDGINDTLGDPIPVHDLVVEHANPTRCDCPHRQFGVPGHAEFADEEDIQRCAEPPGDFEGNGNTPAREAEDHDVVSACVLLKKLSQLRSGFAPIGKRLNVSEHRSTSRNLDGSVTSLPTLVLAHHLGRTQRMSAERILQRLPAIALHLERGYVDCIHIEEVTVHAVARGWTRAAVTRSSKAVAERLAFRYTKVTIASGNVERKPVGEHPLRRVRVVND
jgi:hypothetical protein